MGLFDMVCSIFVDSSACLFFLHPSLSTFSLQRGADSHRFINTLIHKGSGNQPWDLSKIATSAANGETASNLKKRKTEEPQLPATPFHQKSIGGAGSRPIADPNFPSLMKENSIFAQTARFLLLMPSRSLPCISSTLEDGAR